MTCADEDVLMDYELDGSSDYLQQVLSTGEVKIEEDVTLWK